jgi:hypothetical protein
VNNRLTLNLGLRFDRYRVFLPEQAHPAGRFNPTLQTFPVIDTLIDWNVLAPRIGAGYDLGGDGKTIASYGHYWWPRGPIWASTRIPTPTSGESATHGWTANVSGVGEPGEQGELADRRGGLTLELLDPRLELPTLREAAAWSSASWVRTLACG